MNSEERIIQFIEHELSPEQERAVLDECAASDEMRTMLKQHVALSRTMTAALSAVAVPAAAEEKVAEHVAGSRGIAPSAVRTGLRRGIVVSAIAGLTVLGFLTVAYLASRTPIATAPPVVVPAPAADAAAPMNVASVQTIPQPAPSKPQVIRRRPLRHTDAPPALAEKSPSSNDSRAAAPKPGKRKIQLTPKDLVH